MRQDSLWAGSTLLRYRCSNLGNGFDGVIFVDFLPKQVCPRKYTTNLVQMKKRLILGFAVIAVAGLLLMTSLALKQERQALAVEQAKERHEDDLMAIHGVVGVGIGECEGKPCVRVYLERESAGLKESIPAQLDGFTVDTEVTGPVEALPR